MAEARWFEHQQRWVLNPAYYAQAVAGHLSIVSQAKSVDDWLLGHALTDVQRQRLNQAQEMRRFASDSLGLPRNSSYTRFADLQRSAVVWNVVATPALSLKLHQWCFPFAGCVGYRGFYKQETAEQFAASLPPDWDVKVYPVAAYSTLGWTQWLGGDPLLNTMLAYPELELAELLFHELAHQQVYIKDDTSFNESYATAVERLGVAAWKSHRQSDPEFAEIWRLHLQWRQRREDFQSLVRPTQQDLKRLYTQHKGSGPIDAMKLAKAQILQDFEERFVRLNAEWGGQSRWSAWVDAPNNALFAIQHSYTQWVPAFERLFAQVNGDWAAFHAEVKEIGQMPKDHRDRRLQALQSSR